MKRIAHNRYFRLLVLLFAGFAATAADDARSHFEVLAARATLKKEVYHFSARVRYRFAGKPLEALDSGVPITIELQIEVLRPRRFIWDEVVYSLSQRYRIVYHALTRQYLVTNLNSNVRSSHTSREAALASIGNVRDIPILDRGILEVGETYYGRVRARLYLGDLPMPLRLYAYSTSAWRISSEWFRWKLP